jgi:hypothetical protein
MVSEAIGVRSAKLAGDSRTDFIGRRDWLIIPRLKDCCRTLYTRDLGSNEAGMDFALVGRDKGEAAGFDAAQLSLQSSK